MSLARLLMHKNPRDFLVSGESYAQIESVAERHGLKSDRTNELLDLTDAVIDGVITVDQMPPLVVQAFAVTPEVAQEIARDLLGYRLLPLERFLTGISEQLVAWGGKVADYPELRVQKEKISPVAWAKRINERMALNFTDVLVKRLAFLLEQRSQDEKNASSFRTFLGRSINVGGLGLVKERGDELAKIVEEDIHELELVDDRAYAAATGSAVAEEKAKVADKDDLLPMVSESHELVTDIPVVNGGVVKEAIRQLKLERGPTDEELKDAARRAKELKREEGKRVSESLAKATDLAAMQAAPILEGVGASKKTFMETARSAIRGIRDLYQVRDVFENDLKVTGPNLVALLEAVKAGQDEYHKLAGPAASNPEYADESASPEEIAERAILDARFSTITKSTPKESVAPVMPGSRVSAARTSDDDLVEMADKAMKNVSPVTNKPEKAQVQLTVGSVPPSQNRKMSDVVRGGKLMGPVEQLGSMTIAEFRRLSSEPQEATRKVRDLLTTLEAQGYEERVRGVKAWRMSPVNQLYVRMTEESLQRSVSLAEVATTRRAQGAESLSPAEVKALTELNREMRF